jgi:hypothetical protein
MKWSYEPYRFTSSSLLNIWYQISDREISQHGYYVEYLISNIRVVRSHDQIFDIKYLGDCHFKTRREWKGIHVQHHCIFIYSVFFSEVYFSVAWAGYLCYLNYGYLCLTQNTICEVNTFLCGLDIFVPCIHGMFVLYMKFMLYMLNYFYLLMI